MPKIRPYSSQSCITQLDFPTAESVAACGGRSVPLIPSIVERVRSGPERSRARRFLARRSATLDGEDRCETITEGRKEPSSNSAYPLQSLNSLFIWAVRGDRRGPAAARSGAAIDSDHFHFVGHATTAYGFSRSDSRLIRAPFGPAAKHSG